MMIVFSTSFWDHRTGTKDPETDGGTSQQTHVPKGPSIKVGAFLWGWDAPLMSESPCLTSGNQFYKVTKYTRKTQELSMTQHGLTRGWTGEQIDWGPTVDNIHVANGHCFYRKINSNTCIDSIVNSIVKDKSHIPNITMEQKSKFLWHQHQVYLDITSLKLSRKVCEQ